MLSKETFEKIVEEMESPMGETIDKKVETQLFKDLISVEGLLDYLKITMGEDMKRYFTAMDDKMRDEVRGHFSFASFLRSKIMTEKKLWDEEKITKLDK